MRKIVRVAAALVAGLAPAAAALASGAAPTYVTSDPQNGATVESPPSRVSITFSEPLDSSSTLQVFDECGRGVDAGDAQVLGSRIDVGIAQSPSGHYTAVYVAKGFGGATGETKGSISFHVTSGESCDGGHGGHGGHGNGGGGGGHNGGGHGGGGGHNGGNGHGGGKGSGSHGNHMGGSDETHHSDDGDDHGTHGGDGSGHGDGDHGNGGHGGNGKDHRGDGEHSKGHGGVAGSDDPPELASDRGALGLAPTTSSVVIALALSIAMGAVGGWVLRVSAGS